MLVDRGLTSSPDAGDILFCGFRIFCFDISLTFNIWSHVPEIHKNDCLRVSKFNSLCWVEFPNTFRPDGEIPDGAFDTSDLPCKGNLATIDEGEFISIKV